MGMSVLVAVLTVAGSLAVVIIQSVKETRILQKDHNALRDDHNIMREDHKLLREDHKTLGKNMQRELDSMNSIMQEVQKYVYEETVLREKSKGSAIDYVGISAAVNSMGKENGRLQEALKKQEDENEKQKRLIAVLTEQKKDLTERLNETTRKYEKLLQQELKSDRMEKNHARSLNDEDLSL